MPEDYSARSGVRVWKEWSQGHTQTYLLRGAQHQEAESWTSQIQGRRSSPGFYRAGQRRWPNGISSQGQSLATKRNRILCSFSSPSSSRPSNELTKSRAKHQNRKPRKLSRNINRQLQHSRITTKMRSARS